MTTYFLNNTTEWLNSTARSLPFTRGHPVVFVKTTDTEPHPPAPAWYDPKTGDAFIHVDDAGIDMEALNASYDNQHRSTARGLLVHEIAHSRWSEWLLQPSTIKAMTPAQHSVATMFEEMRVEYRALNTDPDYRIDLRAALGIIIRGMAELPTTRYEVAHAWGIVYGRSLTTVIDHDELQWMDDAARTVLGDDDVAYLSDLLQEAIELEVEHEGGIDRMITVAQEWINIVGEPPMDDEAGCGCGENGQKAEAMKDDGKGKGKPGDPDDGDDEAVDDLSSTAGVANSIEDVPEVAESEPTHDINVDEGELIKNMLERTLDEVAENWNNTVVDLANPEELARKVFGGKLSSALREFPPEAHHARHVAETARVLENMVIPAITKVSVAAEVPPGRLRTREAVRASAERSQGRMITARPWEATKRRHSSVRPIVVGIATDTSGSMRWAESAVADFAYTWANAGQRVGARTAAVTFGNNAVRVAKPGEVLSVVRRKDANGGREAADHALAALDGGLKFSHQNGAAKLLVVVSDGHLVISHEGQRVVQRLKQFKAAGTKVIWVTPEKGTLIRQLKKQDLAEVVHVEVNKYSYDSIHDGTTFDLIQQAVLTKLRTMTH